jgi:hypothetical protein
MKGKQSARIPVAIHFLIVLSMVIFSGCGEPRVERIQVTPDPITLSVGQTAEFNAKPLTGKGEEVPGVALRWSVEGDAGSVDPSGLLTARKPGEVWVMAAANGVTGKAKVLVNPLAPARLEVHPDKTAALPGSAITVRLRALTAENEPAGYNEVTLSSPTEGASISPQAVALNPEGEGQCTFTLSPQPGVNVLKVQSGRATHEIRLEATEIVRLEILPRDDQFEAGQEVSFEAIGFDEHGNRTTVAADWSVSGDAAEIREGFTVLMREPGKGILLARYKQVTQGRPFTIVPGRLARLEIEPTGAALQAGQTASFSAKGTNAHGRPVPVQVQWSVEGEVGTIARDGAFLARIAGKGAVKASSDSVTAQVPVEVQHGPLSEIVIEIDKQELTAGETTTLRAQGADVYGNRFSISPQWSLSRSIGTINQQESTFTPLHAGTGEIRASVGNILKSASVEVFPAELARLQMAPQNLDVVAGEEVRFEVHGSDRFGNRVEVSPEFSMEEALGELSPEGKLKATKSGSTLVRARVKGFTAESTLAVTATEVAKVFMEPQGPLELVAGRVQEFKAFGFDAFGNTVESSVRWSVHPDLGSQDDGGVFLPKKAGRGEIIASLTQTRTGKMMEGRALVSVVPGEATRIDVQPAEIQLTAGRDAYFSATGYDQFGNEAAIDVSWSLSDLAMGSMSEAGLFGAVKAGPAKVLARHGNVTGEAKVLVAPAEIAFLKIIPEALSLKAGEKVELKALGEDRFGNAVDARVVWSLSDPAMGSVAPDRVLTARKQGKGHVIAASRNIVDMAPLEVTAGPLHAIRIEPGEVVIQAGEAITFAATGLDVAGNPLEISPQWTGEEQLGILEQNGLFSARKAGAGEVAAAFEGTRGTARIKVLPGPPASINVAPEALTMAAGNRETLAVEVVDAVGNPIRAPELRWELEKGLGALVEPDQFHARKTGQEIIRLTAGHVTVQVPVTINAGRVHRIEITPLEADVTAGDRVSFTARAYDIEGNDVPGQHAWAVGGTIGTVGEDGVFQAIKAGSGHVSLQMDGVMGLALVRVGVGPIARIDITPPEGRIKAGETTRFNATPLDAQGNVTPDVVIWSMSPEVNGRMTTPTGAFQMLKAGESRVIAAAGGVQGMARVHVEPASVAAISLTPESINLAAGEEVRIAVSGGDAHGNPVSLSPDFSVSPGELGSVTVQGLFTARQPGTGRLTVRAEGVQATAPVEITPGPVSTLALELPGEDIVAGKSYELRATGYDKGGNEVPVQVQWAVTEGIGRIDLTSGVFHATRTGTGMVVAYGHGLTAEKVLEVKPGVLHRFFIEPNPVDVQSNMTQTFKIKGFDIKDNAVAVAVSALSWNQVGDIGVFEEPGVFRGTRMGRGKVTAGLGGLSAEVYVNVVPGRPDPANSRIRVTHPVLPGDGQAFSEIILEIRDHHNNPVPDVQATLVSSRQIDSVAQPPKTDQQGRTRGRISSTNPGTSVISVVIQGQTIRDTDRVTFE